MLNIRNAFPPIKAILIAIKGKLAHLVENKKSVVVRRMQRACIYRSFFHLSLSCAIRRAKQHFQCPAGIGISENTAESSLFSACEHITNELQNVAIAKQTNKKFVKFFLYTNQSIKQIFLSHAQENSVGGLPYSISVKCCNIYNNNCTDFLILFFIYKLFLCQYPYQSLVIFKPDIRSFLKY